MSTELMKLENPFRDQDGGIRHVHLRDRVRNDGAMLQVWQASSLRDHHGIADSR